jgi:plasmid stabilization system protein ParE
MKGYRLSVPAQEDLSGIFDYYFEEAGYRVAREMMAEFVSAFRTIAMKASVTNARISPAIARCFSG